MRLLSLFLALAGLAGCSLAPVRPAAVARGDYEAARAYATKMIRYEMGKNAVAGLSIALVDDQRVIWAEGFGYADRERGIPATADTLYRVGSISKLFTAVAALQLAEQGKLDIDQPLGRYLPGFAIKERTGDATAITPRQLMTHHAGLSRDRLKGFMNSEPRPFAEVVNELHDDYAAYPSGLVFSYSNLGVALLGAAVQDISGRPFADYLRQSVLVPLGMRHSTFDTGISASPLAARGYRGLAAALEPPLRDVPAGGLNSSVAEMSRFMAMMFAGGTSGEQRILRAETLAEMLRVQNKNVPLDFNFHVGLGWGLSTVGNSTIENAGPVAHHAGGTILFHSQMYILPQHKLGVVVLTNSSTGGPVADRIATAALTLALQAKSGIRQPDRKKAQSVAGPVPPEIARGYVGDYTTIAGFAGIYQSGTDLRVRVAGRDFRLLRRADGTFGLDYALLGLFHVDLGSLGELGFSRQDLAGRELLLAHAGGQELLVGQRIEPPSNIGLWRGYLGNYEIADLGNDYPVFARIRLAEERGFLLLELTMAEAPGQTQRIPLQPLSEREALLLGPLNDGGATLRVAAVGSEKGLIFSGYLLRKKAP